MLIIFNRYIFTTLLVLIYHYQSASANSIVVRREVKPDNEITTASPIITTPVATNTTTATQKIPEALKPDEKHQKVPNLVPKSEIQSDREDDVQASSMEHNDSTQNNLSGYGSLTQNDEEDGDDGFDINDDMLIGGGGIEDKTQDDKTESPDIDGGAKGEEGENDGVTELMTEDYRFDISKYMTDASTPVDIETTTHIEPTASQHQTTTLDMKKQFDDLELTTPQTPYFDEKHKQYKYDAGDHDDDDVEKVDHTMRSHIDDNDFLSSNIETTTSELSSFDPTTIVTDTADDDEITSNTTDTKNSTYISNVSVVEQMKYNINSNEVQQINKELEPAITTLATVISGATKQKKGKYLNDFSDGSSTPYDLDAVTDKSNALKESNDSDDLSSALAALKHVEHLTQQTGQAVNITTTSSSHGNDHNSNDDNSENGYDGNKHVKTIIDWASIMENNEYTSDTAQMGDISTTTEKIPLDMDTDEVENKVSLLTAIPPKAVDDGKRLDDVSLDDDDEALMNESSTMKNVGLSTSTPATDSETSPNINDYDELSTVLPNDTDDDIELETDDDETTTTENNFIVRDSDEKIKVTTSIVSSTSRVTISRGGTTIVPLSNIQSETTSAPTTTTTTTEAIRIEILNPSASASTINYEKDIADITSYTEKNTKIDTSLDSSNSIERITEKIIGVNYSTAAPTPIDTNIHEGNSLPVDTNQDNLKYNTVSETTQKPVTDETPSTLSTNQAPLLHGDTATLSSKQNFDESLLIPQASEDEGMDVNVIIAISVCTVGLVALILLVGFLVLMRKRQKNLTYGQRCRPVGLDAYSLDNVSVYNSVRRKNNFRLSKRSYGNSAFEDPGLKNNMLKIGDLATFIQNQNTIFEEFKDIPMVTARVDEVPAGCEAKNRYANVVPLPETRVHLKRINDDEKTEYINANYVKGPKDLSHYYIACQAPLENTISDFWRMIWEQNSKVIIMATDLNENGIEKCADYLPPSVVLDCNRQFDDYQVTLKNREVKDKYAVSTVHLKNMQTNTWREITHLWYQWPDTGVPTDEASIIAMLLEARSYLKMSAPEQSDESCTDGFEANGAASDPTTNGIDKTRSLQREQGPITVHCSPGTGRTGTIVACDIAIRALEMPTRSVDVPQIVYYVRRGRASSVRTREQYEFIYKVVNMYGTKLTGPAAEN